MFSRTLLSGSGVARSPRIGSSTFSVTVMFWELTVFSAMSRWVLSPSWRPLRLTTANQVSLVSLAHSGVSDATAAGQDPWKGKVRLSPSQLAVAFTPEESLTSRVVWLEGR